MSTFGSKNLFESAARAHQAGQLAQAEQGYRAFLEHQPRHAKALLYLSMVLHARGENAQAVEFVRRSISVDSSVVEAHNNLGVYLLALSQFQPAEGAFRQAIAIKPDHAKAFNNLGNALKELNRVDEAIAAYRKSLSLDPKNASAHNNLANALALTKQFEEAFRFYNSALSLGHSPARVHANLANALRDAGQLPRAVENFQKAISLEPANADLHNSLGAVFYELRQHESAVACFQKALSLQPSWVLAMNNLGGALHALNRTEEAINIYRQALLIDPASTQAMNNLGYSLRDMAWRDAGLRDEAIALFTKAIKINPNYAEAQLNLSISELLAGDYEKGLARNEWRFQAGTTLPGARLGVPRWEGEPFAGKTVLVTYEQGLGDVIQFARYLPRLKSLGGRVVLQCQPPLVRLMQQMPGIDQVVSLLDPLLPGDFPHFHAPIMSLPRIFKTKVDSIPRSDSYIALPQEAIKHWSDLLAGLAQPRIGISWRGNPKHKNDRFRSMSDDDLRPLLAIPGITWISLQKDGSQLVIPPIVNLDAQIHDLFDTAGLMMNLDLVISVDTSTVHLAGALGRETWTLLPANPDWRWGIAGETSAWYPSVRLFRQTILGDWSLPVSSICAMLTQRFAR